MLSICIPVYNVLVYDLLSELKNQLSQLDKPCEIICIDDCSDESIKLQNIGAIAFTDQYIQLKKNIGRSAIRNLFLEYANYPYLLFLDCDVQIRKQDFLQNYLEAILAKHWLICGGHEYAGDEPEWPYLLKWNYGKSRESKSIKERLEKPQRSFMPSNFVIKKEVLQENLFDTRLSQYGHEDTLFAYRLSRAGVQFHHIQNPVVITDLELNEVYLNKTEQGIYNLKKILEFSGNDPQLIAHVSLLRFYFKIRKNKSLFLFKLFFGLFKESMRKQLLKGSKSLLQFDLYKLAFLSSIMEADMNQTVK